MITNYTHPQTTIHQLLRNISVNSAPRMNTLVIGPQFKLHLNDGRELYQNVFNSGGDQLLYTYADGSSTTGQVVDLDSVGFYGKDLLANTVLAPLAVTIEEETASYAIIRNDVFLNGPGNPDSDLRGRYVQIGDKVLITPSGGTGVFRNVVGLMPAVSPAVVEAAATAYDAADDIKATKITRTSAQSAYTGSVDTRYQFECITAGAVGVAVVRVWDSAGIEPVQTLYGASGHLATTGVAIGTHGVQVGFAADLVLALGDKFYLSAAAVYTSEDTFTGIRVDGPVKGGLVTTSASMVVYQPYTGWLTAANTASGTTDFPVLDASATYPASLGLSPTAAQSSAFCAFANGIGTVALTFKASLLTTAQEEVLEIASDTDAEELGEVKLQNWLGMGVSIARAARAGTVYALRTDEDTVEAFTASLKKIRNIDTLYAIAVMTDSQDVMELVADHCVSQSAPNVKNFRRCYVGTDSPGEYTVWGALSTGSYRTASLAGTQVVIAEESRQYGSFLDVAHVGDFIKFNVSDTKYPIVAVLSAQEVTVTNVNNTSLPDSAFSLIRANNLDNTVRFVSERSSALSNRRCTNIWCDNPVVAGTDGYDTLPCKYFAAEVAGLRTAMLPQQGLTMTELEAADSAPNMYNMFGDDELNEIAANGTLIVMQDGRNGPLYVRHQLSTETEEGSLAYEDNVGVVVDAFSFGVKDAQRGTILGKKNVTRETMSFGRQQLLTVATDATQTTAQYREIGPLIQTFFDEDGKEGAVTFKINPNRADGFISYVRIRVALPVNGIDNYIDADAAVEL